MSQEILTRLKDMLISRLKLKVTHDQINEDTMLFGPGSLELDSIDVLELVIGIKKEFGVEIADRQMAEKVFISIGSVARFIDENS